VRKIVSFLKLSLFIFFLTTAAYGEVVEGMVLSAGKGRIVVVTADGKKEFAISPARGRHILPPVRPGAIVVLYVKGGVVKKLKVKGIPQ